MTPETAFELLSAPPIAKVKVSAPSLAVTVIPFPPTKSTTPAAGLTVVPPEDIPVTVPPPELSTILLFDAS